MWQIMATLSMLMIEGSYLPQVYKLHKTKQAKDFNLMFPLLNAGGRLLAMMYTLSRGEWVLAIGFLFGLTIRFVLLGQVIYFQDRPEEEQELGFFAVVKLRLQRGLTSTWRGLASYVSAHPLTQWRPRLVPASGLVSSALPKDADKFCLPERCDDDEPTDEGWWQRLCAVVEAEPVAPARLARPKKSLRAAMCQPEECRPAELTASLPDHKRCCCTKG